MALVEFGLDEGNSRHKVLEDVRRVRVVDVDLVTDEGLCCNTSGVASGRGTRGGERANGPHGQRRGRAWR